MKKICTLLCIATLLLTSCVDDDEIDLNTIGITYEINNVNFDTSSNSSTRFFFPENIFESDVVLVYRLRTIDNGRDVWEPLPTTLFFGDGGFAQYLFNFTIADVDILLESDDVSLLPTDLTDNQVFRIVVVPADFAINSTIDVTDINAVLTSLKIKEHNIQKISID